MALYFITYDLRKERDYKTLYAALKEFEAIRVLDSTWCFKRINTTVAGLRAHFKQFLDNDDGLLIDECTGNWAAFNAKGTPNDLK